MEQRESNRASYEKSTMTVPHSESGMAPMSSLSGVELLGFRGLGINGLVG
jgi:hypothetical protein